MENAMIPTQQENPKGLHQRYAVYKISQTFVEGTNLVLPDPNAEYFVMRLDEGGSDREHIKACRVGIHSYAYAIEHHLPELARDLRERYPLL